MAQMMMMIMSINYNYITNSKCDDYYLEMKVLQGYIDAATVSLAMRGSGTLRYVDTTERLTALLMSCRAKCTPFVTALQQQQQAFTVKKYK